MQEASSEKVFEPRLTVLKPSGLTVPLTVQLTFILPVLKGVIRVTVSGAPWRTFESLNPTWVVRLPVHVARDLMSMSKSTRLATSWALTEYVPRFSVSDASDAE